MGEGEDPVWDNFSKDPHAGGAMVETAENLVRETGVTREQQDEITLLRHEQYEAALADDRAFQRRYMIPVELKTGKEGDRKRWRPTKGSIPRPAKVLPSCVRRSTEVP